MDWLAPVIVRQPSQEFISCSPWWDHPEVLLRITGLRETWEPARLAEGIAINDWLATQLDHHLTVITSPGGPFFRCKSSTGDTPGEQHTPSGLALPPSGMGPEEGLDLSGRGLLVWPAGLSNRRGFRTSVGAAIRRHTKQLTACE